MEHPKIGGLSDGAFRLWVEGLAYCQKFLTDGVIVAQSMRGLRAFSLKRRQALLDAGLWHDSDGSVVVHDYLDWNESKEQVLRARQMARHRIAKLRGKKHGCNGEQTPLRAVNTSGVVSCSGSAGEKKGGAGGNLAFAGKVLQVPKFLDGEFVTRLNGQYFDLTSFYLALDQRLTQTGEPWDLRWIRDQFAAESPQPERPVTFTADERSRAERLRRRVGRCTHEPKHETVAACIAEIILAWREEEAAVVRGKVGA